MRTRGFATDSASGQSVTTCASESSLMVGGWFCGDVGEVCEPVCAARVEVKTRPMTASSSTERTAAVRFAEDISDSLLSGWQIQAHRLNQNPAPHNGILHLFKTPNPPPLPPRPLKVPL